MVCMALGGTEAFRKREVLVLVITTATSRLPTSLLEVEAKEE